MSNRDLPDPSQWDRSYVRQNVGACLAASTAKPARRDRSRVELSDMSFGMRPRSGEGRYGGAGIHRIIRWLVVIAKLWIASFLAPSSITNAQNFSACETELQNSAEAARERSARYWSGRSLPGRWSTPCPVDWSQRTGPASGLTCFQIQGGEVFGWRMTLRGDRDAILQDVIPHEVDHAVRASLCRRPLPRWLDEGCATLFESPSSHERLRRLRLTSPVRILNAETIDQLSYPVSSTETAQLYAEGFSLVEYLLSRGTPQQLLEVQRTSDPPTQSLVQAYRVALPQLLSDWELWEQNRLARGTRCDCVNCPWHRSGQRSAVSGQPEPVSSRGPVSGSPPPNGSTPWPGPIPATRDVKPTLTIWTASWCGPCQQFHRDLARAPRFRQRLESKYQIVERDIDQSPQAAQLAQVARVPTFITPDRRVAGYLGPEWLLLQLGLEETDPPATPFRVPAMPPPLLPLAAPKPEQPRPESTTPLTSAPTPAPTQDEQWAPPRPIPSQSPSLWSRVLGMAPTVLTTLSSLGIISGTALTGGVGGVALMLFLKLLQRRATRDAQGKSPAVNGGVVPPTHAPFPRQLDEAGELLGLRQSEGRVATLDALRGMFLDDEYEKLKDDPDSRTRQVVDRIFAAINHRVDEAAPLTTKG